MASFTPSSVLVTGGAGFIASNFLNYMVKKYPGIVFVNIDKLTYCSSLKNIEVSKDNNYFFVKGSVGSMDLISHVLKEYQIDTVLHFAAQSHVCNSFDSSIDYTKDNVLATHILLEACKQYGGIKRFIHVSTDEVYGEIETGTCNEHSLLLPTNPYAATKAAAELIVRAYQISHNLPIITTRGNNVWGPRQYPEKIFPKFIMQLLHGQQCTIHGEGKTKRNFLHVDDVVTAFETILFKGEIGKIYNIGTENEYTVLQVADLLRERICPNSTLDEVVKFVPDRPFNDLRYSVDSSLLRQLGWSEQSPFHSKIDEVIKWYENNGMEHWNQNVSLLS